jgi:imidazolonepropionase-like amidohydrolase
MASSSTGVFRNCTLIAGADSDPVEDAVIVVEDGRIQAAGPAADFSDLPGGEERDLGGCTITPGLINAHEHLTWRRAFGDFTTRVVNRPAAALLGRGFGHALVSLLEGVTTVRDVGSKDALALTLKEAIEGGDAHGPRIRTTGAPIAMTGGHGTGAVCRADGVDEVRRATREQLLAGADWIKLMASGGFVARGVDLPESQQFSLEEMRAAFDEAHRAGKPTTVHAHPPEAIATAIEAGVDCIEHAGFADTATAELMARRGIYVVPTLSALRMEIELGEQMGRPAWLIEACRERLPQQRRVFGELLDAGCKIVAGVDSMGDLQLELEIMVELGMTPRDALRAATATAATCLQMADEVGTIEPGKHADFIAVQGDPLSDIGALRDVALTVKGGVVYEPDALRSLIGPALVTRFNSPEREAVAL